MLQWRFVYVKYNFYKFCIYVLIFSGHNFTYNYATTANNIINVYNSCLKAIVETYFNNEGNKVAYIVHDKNHRIRDDWYYHNRTDDNDDNSRTDDRTAIWRNVSFPFLVTTRWKVNTFNRLRNIVPSGYIFAANNYCDFKKRLQTVNRTHQSWYPRSKFIVYYDGRPKNDRLVSLSSGRYRLLIANDIANVLKKYNVFNFVVLIPLNNSIEIYTRYPFSRTNCPDDDDDKINLIDIFNSDDGFRRGVNLFERKIPRTKFNGCKLKISSFHWPPATLIDPTANKPIGGYNYLAVRLTADLRNLRLEFAAPQKKTRWGIMFENGTWNGILGEVGKGKADLAFGGALQTLNRYMMYDTSVTFQSTHFKFYVPPPLKLPHWRNMIDIFSTRFWLTIGLVNVLVCLVVRYLSGEKIADTTSQDGRNVPNVLDCLFLLWLGTSGSRRITSKSTPIRIVLVAWLIYNLHVSLVYTSSLLGFITRPNYEKPIDSVRQLRRSDLKISIIPQFEPIYVLAAEEDDDMKALTKRIYHYNNYQYDIGTMLTERNVSIFVPSDHYAYYAGRDRTAEIHIVPQDVIRFNTAMYLQKGSPYLEAINHVQMAVFENGLQQKCTDDLTYGLRDSHQGHRRSEYQQALLPLTLHELQGSFYLLIFGLAVSTSAFFAEVVYKNYRIIETR